MAIPIIPTVDLSPFFRNGDEDAKKKAIEMIGQACSEYGFFQIVGHGVPTGIMSRALELSKVFFEYPMEEKLKSSPMPGAPLPAGYNRKLKHLTEHSEFLLMFPPGSNFNVYPANPPELREVLDEIFSQFLKTGLIVESIISECLGLPPNILVAAEI